MSQELALFCLLYPATAEKKGRVTSLLAKNLPYYHSQKAKCTTWCYFTPSQRKGAPNLFLSKDENKNLVIAGMELYTEKSALSVQTADESFKSYHVAVKTEALYSKPEVLVAWQPRGGFMTRGPSAPPFGKGVIVMMAKFITKDAEATEKVVERLATFAEWVKNCEPDVITYCVMTRAKDPKEVLMFERYAHYAAIKDHGSSNEFKAMFKDIRGHLGGPTIMNEFEEMDGTFVGNVVGGQSLAKL